MLQSSQRLFSSFSLPLSPSHNPCLSPPFYSLSRPTSLHLVSAHLRTRAEPLLAQVPDTTTTAPEEGPIELPPSSSSIFATNDDPTPLQVATSVLLTGAISVFLFRSIRRRVKRAKELRFRSSGVKKTLKEEALDSLKAMGSGSVKAAPPSPVQALLGGITAGVIALILYKFTITIEASLNRQTVSDNFSVRQITITIRTIINGLCYLATFVFGINSVGLFLYSGQLALNSFMEGSTSEETQIKGEEQLSTPNTLTDSPPDGTQLNSSEGDQRAQDEQ